MCRAPGCYDRVLGNGGFCSPLCQKVVYMIEDRSNPVKTADEAREILKESNFSFNSQEAGENQ